MSQQPSPPERFQAEAEALVTFARGVVEATQESGTWAIGLAVLNLVRDPKILAAFRTIGAIPADSRKEDWSDLGIQLMDAAVGPGGLVESIAGLTPEQTEEMTDALKPFLDRLL